MQERQNIKNYNSLRLQLLKLIQKTANIKQEEGQENNLDSTHFHKMKKFL